MILFRQPGANIIDTVDAVKAALPHLQAALPPDVEVGLVRTTAPPPSAHRLHDTERTLLIAVGLVTLVVFLFLRDWRATADPRRRGAGVHHRHLRRDVSAAATASTILSLMALTIATGFVVDDAIVVLENISRHLEAGMPRVQAALQGAREVGFTVLSISLSLIAVFIPILLMGGIVGRLFREFALTLSLAILVSLVISLTTTPMMCALLLRRAAAAQQPQRAAVRARAGGSTSAASAWRCATACWSCWCWRSTIGLNVVLFVGDPEGLLPASRIPAG